MLKRSSKVFTLSTETANNKGFRVRTSGIDFSDFPSNPLLLWMHQRPSKENDYKTLPLGNFEDVELKDGKIYGRPCFDPSDQFAMQIYEKVENGTLRMSSPGLLPVLWEMDANGDVWLEKSRLVEASLADIGSNPDALAVKLYDENDQLIELSDEYLATVIPQSKPKNTDMKLIQLSADVVLPLIGLTAEAKPEEVQEKIQELVTLASAQKTTIETLTGEKSTVDAKVVELAAKVTEMQTLADTQKIETLVSDAVTARKITADQKPHFVKLAAVDFESTKGLIESLASNPSAKAHVETAKGSAELVKLSWDELDKSGKLEKLKSEDPEAFKMKYKDKFGKDYPKM